MRTVEEIRAALAAATTEEERRALITELEKALAARSAGENEPSELEQARSSLAEVTTQRSTLSTEFEQITTAAVDDAGNAREFTPEEAENRGRLRAEIDQLDARHTELEDQIRQAEQDERQARMDEQVAQMRRQLGLGEGLPLGEDGLAGVGVTERRTYERGNGVSYLRDLTVRAFGPGLGSAWSQAGERLARHALENHHEALALEERATRTDAEDYFVRQMVEQFSNREANQGRTAVAPSFLSYRALSTASTAGGEFVPPMFLTEQWIEFLRAARVLANCMHHEDLPDGTMSLSIPKVTAGTSVGMQGTQNTNVSNTDMQTAFVTFPVVTFAGQQIVSLQLLERSPISFDQVVMKDLAKAHAQQVDFQCIGGTGTNGQVTGILNTAGIFIVTWTQASPTVKGLYGQIGVAKDDIAKAIFLPATHQFLTSNAWEWIGQSFDANGRPLVVPEYGGPFNVVQVAPDDAQAEGAIGRQLSGLNTFEDNNLPQELGGGKNQDVAIICRGQENHLYESPVVTRALPQTYGAQMSVLLQLYNYGAFTAARYPTANAVITGTGMAASNRTFNS
jgi:HK97 family phage major capsid protein